MKKRRIEQALLRLGCSLLSLLIFILTGCGTNLSGSGTQAGDARPNGPLVGQGQIVGMNGQTTVSGSALVFLQSGTNNYILRIEDYTFPSENGLRILLYGNNNSSTPTLTSALRQTPGAQNYSFTNTTGSLFFTTFYLYSTLNQKNYATAQLSKPE
jgi:hypothetical protein